MKAVLVLFSQYLQSGAFLVFQIVAIKFVPNVTVSSQFFIFSEYVRTSPDQEK